jgi:hypothetical protein
MANAMAQAIGAQAAFPGRQVISVSGDGGFSMLLGDFLTLAQLDLPVKVVVFNNGREFKSAIREISALIRDSRSRSAILWPDPSDPEISNAASRQRGTPPDARVAVSDLRQLGARDQAGHQGIRGDEECDSAILPASVEMVESLRRGAIEGELLDL